MKTIWIWLYGIMCSLMLAGCAMAITGAFIHHNGLFETGQGMVVGTFIYLLVVMIAQFYNEWE